MKMLPGGAHQFRKLTPPSTTAPRHRGRTYRATAAALPPRPRQFRVPRKHEPCVVAGGFQQVAVGFEAGDAKAGGAGLAGAEQFAFAAQAQILFGDAEAVLGVAHDGQAGAGDFAQGVVVEEHAARGFFAAADAAAQLVELGEAETFGMFDDDDGGVGHVDADLDHRRADEEPRLTGLEGAHGLVLVAARHAAMHEADALAEDGCE